MAYPRGRKQFVEDAYEYLEKKTIVPWTRLYGPLFIATEDNVLYHICTGKDTIDQKIFLSVINDNGRVKCKMCKMRRKIPASILLAEKLGEVTFYVPG